jgi:lauroyl/myristoyl acyltransferase
MVKLRVWVALALAAAGLWSACTLTWQGDLLSLFPQNLSAVQALRETEASSDDSLVVIAPDGGPLDALAASLHSNPGIAGVTTHPLSMAAAGGRIAARLAALSPGRFKELEAALAPDEMRRRLEAIPEKLAGALDPQDLARIRTDPLGVLPLLGESGIFPPAASLPSGLLFVQAAASLPTFAACQEFAGMIRAAAAQAYPGREILLTGRPAYVAEISGEMRRDMITMVAFAVVLISLAFWWFYRSLVPLLVILLLQGLAVLAGLTVARLVFGGLNVISTGFASILLGVGMDYCILTYHHFASGHGRDADWLRLRRGIWFSALTTAGAFGVLCFSSFPGLQQLALLVATGLLTTAWAATSLLPGILEKLRPRLPERLLARTEGLAGWLEAHRAFLRIAAVVVLLAGMAALVAVRGHSFYDGDLGHLQPAQLEAHRAQKLLTGPVSADPPAPDPANASLWNGPHAEQVEAAFAGAGYGPQWAAMTVAVARSLDHWVATGIPPGNAWGALRDQLGAAAKEDAWRLGMGVLLVILALCALIHRSLRLVGLNLLALVWALVSLAWLLVLTGTSMTVVSLLCIPLLIGLVADYSIHLLAALEAHRGDLRATYRHLAAPVFLTGVTSLIGCGVPMLSGQPSLQNFGLVMDLGVFSAVTAGLFVLPLLYVPGRAGTHISRALYRSGWFSTGDRIARRVPRGVMRWIGATGGRVYAATHPEKVGVVARNLALLGSAKLRPGSARRVYAEFGMVLADYFYAGARPRSVGVGWIPGRSGYRHLKEAHDAGKGCLLVTAHLGLFELGGLLMTELGFPTSVLVAPEPSEALTRWRADYRKRWGVGTIEVGDDPLSFTVILDELRRGNFVAALIDRPHPAQNVSVRLPGGTMQCPAGIALLAMLADCPIVPVTVVGSPDGSYHVEAHPPVRVVRSGTRDETLREATQKVMDCLLPVIREHPEQWFQFVSLS